MGIGAVKTESSDSRYQKQGPVSWQGGKDRVCFSVRQCCRGGQRVSGAGVAEKKIAILEQALRHHPGSDELLLALLGAVEVVLSGDDVEERWRRVLAHHGGSARLWQAFLSWQRARFGTFSCPAMRVSYGDAVIVRSCSMPCCPHVRKCSL